MSAHAQLFLYVSSAHPALHSFPTRRSSDLIQLFSQLKNLNEIKVALAALPGDAAARMIREVDQLLETVDRKSTRLNSSHSSISYAVFCLKKKKKKRSGHHPRRGTRRYQCAT